MKLNSISTTKLSAVGSKSPFYLGLARFSLGNINLVTEGLYYYNKIY